MPTNLTRSERETIARFSEDPDDPMTFETFNKRHALRLIKAGAVVVRTASRGDAVYWTLSMPRRWFKWPRPPRTLSAEALAAARDRIGGVRSLKKTRLRGENPESVAPGTPEEN